MSQHRPNMTRHRLQIGPTCLNIGGPKPPNMSQHRPNNGPSWLNMCTTQPNTEPTRAQHTPNMRPTQAQRGFIGANTPVRAVVVAKRPEYSCHLNFGVICLKNVTFSIKWFKLGKSAKKVKFWDVQARLWLECMN